MKDFAENYKDYYKEFNWHLAMEVLNNGVLLRWVMLLDHDRVLEVGAGSGKTCVLLKRLLRDTHIVASDINPELCEGISRLASAAGEDISIECCDVRKLPYADKSFDISFSSGLLEHLKEEDMVAAMREQLRVAKVVMTIIPLFHWYAKVWDNITIKTDIIWPKAVWLRFFSRVGNVMDITLFGPPAEEILMLALVTREETYELPLAWAVSGVFGASFGGKVT